MPTKSELGKDLDKTRLALEEAQHAPGYVYSSPEIFQLEKEKIFMRDWLCVARVEELEKPGDFLTFTVMGEPIVVTRDAQKRLNAFSNVCRHRGAEIISGSGNVTELACPFHGWLYDLEGKLIGAPYMKEAKCFDRDAIRLNPLRVDVWAGWVFVTFSQNPSPLNEFVSDFAQDFGFLKMENCRLFTKWLCVVKCNWKLAVENLQDNYHIQAVHKDTVGKYQNFVSVPLNLRKRAGVSCFFATAPNTVDRKTRFGKMPWLEDKSLDFGCMGYLAPHFHMFGRIDEVHPFLVWPISPDETQIWVYHLFPAQHFGLSDFAERAKAYQDYLFTVMAEDEPMLASVQRAMKLKTFAPGRISKMEVNLHGFINYSLDRIFEAAQD